MRCDACLSRKVDSIRFLERPIFFQNWLSHFDLSSNLWGLYWGKVNMQILREKADNLILLAVIWGILRCAFR